MRLFPDAELSTTQQLANRGYIHTPTRQYSGRHAVIRDGRIVTVGTCYETNAWIDRLDRKVLALRSKSDPALPPVLLGRVGL